MKSPVTRWCLVLSTALTFWGCSQSSTASRVAAIAAGSPAPSDSNDPAHLIDEYVVGEGTDFENVQGDRIKESGPFVYYQAMKQLPGASACSVYLIRTTNHRYGTCNFDASNRAAADKLYQTWLANVESAEPSYKHLDLSSLPSGVVEGSIFADDKEQRGIYVAVSKNGPRQYLLTITFAKMSALRS